MVTYFPVGSSESIQKSTKEYDLEQAALLQKQQLISLAIIAGLHLYGGYIQPLFLQIFLPWSNLLSHQLSRIHLFNKKISRPFAAPSLFAREEKEEKKE